MSNLNDHELQVLTEAKKYFVCEAHSKKAKDSKILSKITDTLSKTFEIDHKIIKQLNDFLFDCGELVTLEKRILNKAKVKSVEEIKLFELVNCDQLSNKLKLGHQLQHVSHGAATGAFGLIGFGFDILTSPVLRNKSLLELGMAYGYNKEETKLNYTIALLLKGSDHKQKANLLSLLQKAKKQVLEKIEKEGVENITELFIKAICKDETVAKYLIELAEKMGIKLSQKTAGRLIPLIGAVFGGAFSLSDYNELKESCQHFFRLDWLLKRGKITEIEYQNIVLGEIG
jgi:hypothetical protein